MRHLLLLLLVMTGCVAQDDRRPLVRSPTGTPTEFPNGDTLRVAPRQGLDADKGAAASYTKTIYIATDTETMYLSNGGSWVEIGSSATAFADNVFSVYDEGDSTKVLVFTLGAQAASTTLTINTGAQTASRVLSYPLLIADDTLASLGLASQAFSGSATFAGTTSPGANRLGVGQSAPGVSRVIAYGADATTVGQLNLVISDTDETGLETPVIITTTGVNIAAGQKLIANNTTAATTSQNGAFRVGDGSLAATDVSIGGGNINAGGSIVAGASTTSAPSFRMPHGAAPSAPTNGDLWTTTGGAFVRISGVTVGPLAGADAITGSLTTGRVPYASGATTVIDSSKLTFSSSTGLVVNMASSGANNLTIGSTAGDTLSSGTQNTFIGTNAGTQVATTSDATAVGYNALALNTAADNTAVGSGAGDAITTGTGLTAVGKNALGATTGNNNTAIGSGAGAGITSGGDNVAIGVTTLNAIAAGDNNIAIGTSALALAVNVNSSVAIGYHAGDQTLNGNNVAIGSNALGAASGASCTAVGTNALVLNTGASNTAVGASAGQANTSGLSLAAFGYEALSDSTGNNNVGVGYRGGTGITSGTDNVAVGYTTMANVSAGSFNVAVGSGANIGSGTINSNIAIGASAAITVSSASIAIGRGATIASSSNTMVIGGDTYQIADVWIGEGISNATPVAVTLGNTRASGTNIAGANLTIRAGAGTGTGAGGDMIFQTAPATTTGAVSGTQTKAAAIRSTGSVEVGLPSLATNATAGFLYIPTCAGTPTGAPTAVTGMAPMVIDSTNNKLYFYTNGAWRDAGP